MVHTIETRVQGIAGCMPPDTERIEVLKIGYASGKYGQKAFQIGASWVRICLRVRLLRRPTGLWIHTTLIGIWSY